MVSLKTTASNGKRRDPMAIGIASSKKPFCSDYSNTTSIVKADLHLTNAGTSSSEEKTKQEGTIRMGAQEELEPTRNRCQIYIEYKTGKLSVRHGILGSLKTTNDSFMET
jgi:hypothetical protein